MQANECFEDIKEQANNVCSFCGLISKQHTGGAMLWCKACKTNKKGDNHFACCHKCYAPIGNNEHLGILDMVRKECSPKNSVHKFEFSELKKLFDIEGDALFTLDESTDQE